MVAFDTAWIGVIGWVVCAVTDQVVNFRSIEIMLGVKLITSFSSPMSASKHNPVSNHYALEVDGGVVFFPFVGIGIYKIAREVRNVHSAVGFASDPEAVRKEFGELLVPGLQCFNTVRGSAAFVIDIR